MHSQTIRTSDGALARITVYDPIDFEEENQKQWKKIQRGWTISTILGVLAPVPIIFAVLVLLL